MDQGANLREKRMNFLASFGGMFGMGQLRRPVPTCLGLKCGLPWRQTLKWDAAVGLRWWIAVVESS